MLPLPWKVTLQLHQILKWLSWLILVTHTSSATRRATGTTGHGLISHTQVFMQKSLPQASHAGQPPSISQQRLKKFGALQLHFQPLLVLYPWGNPHLPGLKTAVKALAVAFRIRLNRKHILANEIQLGTLTDAFALTAPRPDRSQISPPSPPLDVFGTVAEH